MNAARFEFGVGLQKSRLGSGGIFFCAEADGRRYCSHPLQKQCVSTHQVCFLIPAFQSHLV
jgi:hypothetical protein